MGVTLGTREESVSSVLCSHCSVYLCSSEEEEKKMAAPKRSRPSTDFQCLPDVPVYNLTRDSASYFSCLDLGPRL